MSKRICVLLLTSFALAVLWLRPAAAQLAPTGSHYAGRPSDTGHAGPNDRGGYASSIPLDLPSARSGLPVPVQIISGGKGFGAAGVGWDVPLSYVQVDRSFAHRRPQMAPNVGPLPRDRISISLPGRHEEMLPRGSEWVGRSGNDLIMRYENGGYKAFDGNGLTYTFTQDPAVADSRGSAIFLLSSITGAGGSVVQLSYTITSVALPNTTERGVSIDLASVAYNRDSSNTCFKHAVLLRYAVPLVPAFQSLSRIGERVLVRDHRLGIVDVTSRADCITPAVSLRQYALSYQIDPDTQQEQLYAVKMFGRNGTQEGSIPVVSYTYGTATSSGITAPRVLRYPSTAPMTVDLPSFADVIADTEKVAPSMFTSPIAGFPKSYVIRNTLLDMTGDGRPDLVFEKDGTLWISVNTPDASGKPTFGLAVQLTDNTLTTQYLEARASQVERFYVSPVPHEVNKEYVWRRLIDVNGDGRMDIIDAAQKANHWVIYLNTPAATASGIKWVRAAYNVTTLYNKFLQLGHDVKGGYLPLGRRHTGKDYKGWGCWKWNGIAYDFMPDLNWESPECAGGAPAPPPPDPNPEKTYTEWEVRDINGDGYPDVVFNSRKTEYFWDPADWPSPYHVGDYIRRPRTKLLGLQANQVLAVLNVGGIAISDIATATNPFSAPFTLRSSDCGVGLWSNFSDGFYGVQQAGCGFEEANGDGIVDRVEYYDVYIGTGSSFSASGIKLPKYLEQRSTRIERCASLPPNSLATVFSVANQNTMLRDVTGDGIPDFVDNSKVYVGTGAGFVGTSGYVGTSTPIEGRFRISGVDERCDGALSRTTSGLYDLDADGKPELVELSNIGTWHLKVSPLMGGSAWGAPESGRITGIDSGFGAFTKITYRSAKLDARTKHQVPFPEIVVGTIEPTARFGLGGALSPTEFAYGNIEQFYDSVADGFRATGYRRRVELKRSWVADERFASRATVTDRYALDPVTSGTVHYLMDHQRLGRYFKAGQPSDITLLSGVINEDVWSLLAVDITTDARRIAGAHFDIDTYETQLFSDAAPPANELCYDMLFPYDYELSEKHSAGHYNVCSARGFLPTKVVSSWRGSAAPPSTDNVQTRSQALAVDNLGRVTRVLLEGDLFRWDDDVCVDTVYATPTGSDARVLSAVASRKIWSGTGCNQREGGVTVWAEETWEYDKLPYSVVSDGRVTAHTVYPHATDTGANLPTIREFDIDYDVVGNPWRITKARGAGATYATRTITIEYDSFGLNPVRTSAAGTNVPTLVTLQSYDPVSDDQLSTTDENGTIRGATFDGFGRPVLETVQSSEVNGVLVARSYLGFEGGAKDGRRIIVKEFTNPVDASTVAVAEGRTRTTFLDELGRPRFTWLALGDDYGGETLVVGERSYDPSGRVAFVADPYARSQGSLPQYGTTHYYDRFGAPWLEIRGSGKQPFNTTPDAALERFPTVYEHTFANHVESMRTQTADALTPGSPQAGVSRESIATAAGHVISRSAWRNSTRIEHATFAHDRLGQPTQMVRYQAAWNATNPVVWTWQLDSLGQIRSLIEPSSASERVYSEWGELTETRWKPIAPWMARSVVNTYDAFGRLTQTEEQYDGVSDPVTINRYVYDVPGQSPLVTSTNVAGRLATASAPTGEIVLSYDTLGRVNARSYINSANEVYVERHGVHGDGSQAWLELNLPDNHYVPERVDYAYDTAGELRWIWSSDGKNTQDLYSATQLDAWGRVRSAEFGNGTNYVASYAETGRRLPQALRVSSSFDTRDISFTGFDPIGRELSRTELSPSSGGNYTSTYDGLGRLSSAMRTQSGTTVASWTFSHDPLGNLHILNDQVSGNDATLSYLASDRDQICRVGYGNGGLGGSTCNVIYDNIGNIIHLPTRSGHTTVDYFNSGSVRRLWSTSGLQADFRYDAFGAVQELEIQTGTAEPVRFDRRYGPYITKRTVPKSEYISRQFPGPGISISRRGPQGPWIFQFGESRGTRFTTDEHGTFVQDVNYAPFGEASSTGVGLLEPTFSTEQWNDGDALEGFGLVHLGARLYDPVTGRFLSRDPLLIPRTAATTNPYAFSMNDPVNLSDPTGLDSGPLGSYPGFPPCFGWCPWGTGLGITNWSGSPSSTQSSLAPPPPPQQNNAAVIAVASGLVFMAYLVENARQSRPAAPPAAVSNVPTWGIRFLDGTAAFVGGFAGGLYDMGSGLVDMASNPGDTLRGAYHAISNPGQTLKAAASGAWDVVNAVASGDFDKMGRAASGLVGGSLLKFGGGLAAGTLKKAAGGGPTRFINGVRVVDRRAGTVLEGTVDLKPTLDRIASGGRFPHRNDGSIFQNRPLPGRTSPELPAQAPGYYREYVHPTPGVSGPGPQRVVVGQGGEMFYTPDHYQTFIPLQ